MSVTIKDPSMGEYSIHESFQGVKVLDKNGKQVGDSRGFRDLNEALRDIAQRLVLDQTLEVDLREYTKIKKTVYENITKAQEPLPEEAIVLEETPYTS